MASKDLSQIATTLEQRIKALQERLTQVSGRPLEAHRRKTGTVYLLLDCSTSMEDKLGEARAGAEGFAREALRCGFLVGLGTFASSAFHLLDPQPDPLGLPRALPGLTADGSTDMAAGIALAGVHLIRGVGERILCVVTDGEPNDEAAALAAAATLRAAGVDIMVIGTGAAREDFLKRLATRSALAVKVESRQLGSGIASMAKLLTRQP